MTKSSNLSTLLPIIYADCFDYCLNVSEIYHSAYREKLSLPQVLHQVEDLEKKGLVVKVGDCVTLKGRSALVTIKQERAQVSIKKIIKARRLAKFLSLLPTVQLVGISGSVASFNAVDSDDIDLIVITSPTTLWLTRAIVVSGLIATGSYRTNSRIKDKFCPNLWLTQGCLSLPSKTWYTATEILRLMPIYDRGGVYCKFVESNSWVTHFYPNGYDVYHSPTAGSLGIVDSENSGICETLRDVQKEDRYLGVSRPVSGPISVILSAVKDLVSRFFACDFVAKRQVVSLRMTRGFLPRMIRALLPLLNRLFFFLQLKHMQSKITNEAVGLNYAFFHPQNFESQIKEKVRQKVLKNHITKNIDSIWQLW